MRGIRSCGSTWALAWLTTTVAFSVVGCASLETRLAAIAAETDPTVRSEALTDLEKTIRKLQRPRVRSSDRGAADRATIDRFLRKQFPREPDAVTRAKILSLSLQGELEGRGELLEAGVRDRAWIVRHTAVLGLLEHPVAGVRGILTDLLLNDPEPIVRIECAKAFRVLGSRDWASPLAEVIVDPTEDDSLRYEAYVSAGALIDEEIPFTIDRWRAWLDTNE